MDANHRPLQAGVRTESPNVTLRDVIGVRIRVIARRGYVLEGICLDAWPLVHGGVAVKIKPSDGSAPREVTTLDPLIVVNHRAHIE